MNAADARVRLSVLGAGYVGLVTAAALARLRHEVRCVDRDSRRIADLKRGILPFREPGLDEEVAEALAAGRLTFHRDASAMRGTDAVIVAVGTLDVVGEWTAEFVETAVMDIARDHAAPRLIVIRSTLLPGTTAGLDRAARLLDPDVEIALNPEFTRQGSAVQDFREPDRVVIGTTRSANDSRAVELLRRIYAPMSAHLLVTDAATAELIKMGANAFLAMKIGFANEIARLAAATGADVAAIVDGIGLDGRIGRAFLSPGPGFGGSCLPSQSRALPRVGHEYGLETPILGAIDASNGQQANWVVDQLVREIGSLDGTRIALLGLTFKAATDDLRESPALAIAGVLATRGAQLAVHDPLAASAGVEALVARGVKAMPHEDALSACAGAAAVVVATEWPEYRSMDWHAAARRMAGRIVLDTRQVVDVEAAQLAGLTVVLHGRRVTSEAG